MHITAAQAHIGSEEEKKPEVGHHCPTERIACEREQQLLKNKTNKKK
jgi:hypothetical protein